jgi:tRNA dimethylallyltransferase
MEKKYLIVIAGPTASGKTDTAIAVAKHFGTEIVSADSRQFYKEMNIGTAVPTPAQLALVKHHFVQHKSIHVNYDVAQFEKEGLALLANLFSKRQFVVLTGGSGLYIEALCNGLDNMPEIDPAIRSKLTSLLENEGLAALQRMLQKLDPLYYVEVDRDNPRRLQRALEVCLQTGKPYSYFRQRHTTPRSFETIWLALERDRTELINRINLRVESMMDMGLVQEARKLFPYRQLNALNTVGYKELFSYFDGAINIETAAEQIKINTRQYAKRQMTWFRKNKQYFWVHPNNETAILQHITENLR